MADRGLDDFAVAFRARGDASRDGLLLWSAVVRLTRLGERPVPVQRLASELGRSETDALGLLLRWGGRLLNGV